MDGKIMDGLEAHYLSDKSIRLAVPYIEQSKAELKALQEQFEFNQSEEGIALFKAEMELQLQLEKFNN